MTNDPDTDITRLILDDHDRFRRDFAALDNLQVGGAVEISGGRGRLWRPCSTCTLRPRSFYPHLLRKGGADAADETLDAIGDHNDIRDAVHEASNARTRLRAACFPVTKTLEEFSVSRQTSPAARPRVMAT